MDLQDREWIREQVYEELSVRSKLNGSYVDFEDEFKRRMMQELGECTREDMDWLNEK